MVYELSHVMSQEQLLIVRSAKTVSKPSSSQRILKVFQPRSMVKPVLPPLDFFVRGLITPRTAEVVSLGMKHSKQLTALGPQEFISDAQLHFVHC